MLPKFILHIVHGDRHESLDLVMNELFDIIPVWVGTGLGWGVGVGCVFGPNPTPLPWQLNIHDSHHVE